MQLANIEITVVEKAVEEAARDQLRELDDLQLAVVGGGGGDVVFA